MLASGQVDAENTLLVCSSVQFTSVVLYILLLY